MLGKMLRKLRKKHNESMEQVMKDTGLSKTTIYEIESDRRGIQFIKNIQALAQCYGYTLEIRLCKRPKNGEEELFKYLIR